MIEYLPFLIHFFFTDKIADSCDLGKQWSSEIHSNLRDRKETVSPYCLFCIFTRAHRRSILKEYFNSESDNLLEFDETLGQFYMNERREDTRSKLMNTVNDVFIL